MGDRRLSMVLMGLLVFTHACAIPSAEAEAPDPPAYVYLTWARDDTARSINISWRTMKEGYLGEVLYDTEPRGGDPELYRFRAVGDPDVTPVTYEGLEGYVHHVELTGLEPGTVYYFIAGHSSYGWSEERAFRTAPASRTSFRFVAAGDSHSGADVRPYPEWPESRDNNTKLMAQQSPSFLLGLGDYAFYYNDQWEWDNWFRALDNYLVTPEGLMVPIVPTVGNHEVVYPQPLDYDPETEATNYYAQFNLPGNERWYALSWGPDLRVVVLDSEVLNIRSETWQEQLEWLDAELEASKDYLWRVVIFHRRMVIGGTLEPRQEEWAFLFDRHRVDLVLSGHTHSYERSHPLDWTRAPGEVMQPGDGVIYIIAGGWGGPMTGRPPAWSTAAGPEARFHHLVIDVFENGTLRLRAIDSEGNALDEFTLHKDLPAESPAGSPMIAIFTVIIAVVAAGAIYFLKREKR
ncbi:MAG: metallophosphoesterase family protein [Candidatus Hodarchaeaceae archaeon]|nr:metallophosphoesterase family protein [Candidatus Hodarchaeaceae archaeon]